MLQILQAKVNNERVVSVYGKKWNQHGKGMILLTPSRSRKTNALVKSLLPLGRSPRHPPSSLLARECLTIRSLSKTRPRIYGNIQLMDGPGRWRKRAVLSGPVLCWCPVDGCPEVEVAIGD